MNIFRREETERVFHGLKQNVGGGDKRRKRAYLRGNFHFKGNDYAGGKQVIGISSLQRNILKNRIFNPSILQLSLLNTFAELLAYW